MFLMKLIHICAAVVGVGFGLAIVTIRGMIMEDPAKGIKVITRLSQISFASLILLWISGLWMLFGGAVAGASTLWFVLKILAVLALTAASGSLQYLSFKGPDEPFPLPRPLLAQIAPAAAVTALICAVFAFN